MRYLEDRYHPIPGGQGALVIGNKKGCVGTQTGMLYGTLAA
jgi:hypothetical protein